MVKMNRKTEMMFNQIESIFCKMETFPVSAHGRLVALLEKANNDVLDLLVLRKVKFVWIIANRIRNERKK